MRLLLIEDDDDVAATLTAFLRKHGGYVIDRADSIDMAREALASNRFDLVIVDRMLSDGDATVLVTEAMASARPQRFVILTAMAGVDDTVAGLDAGAVDYVGKPFEPRELLARIRNALRRELPSPRELKRFGRLSYDVESEAFAIDDEPLVLRRTEALILAVLMNRPGALVQRESLEARVYGYDRFVNANSVESHISRLRRHLDSRSAGIRILAIRGAGYRLSDT